MQGTRPAGTEARWAEVGRTQAAGYQAARSRSREVVGLVEAAHILADQKVAAHSQVAVQKGEGHHSLVVQVVVHHTPEVLQMMNSLLGLAHLVLAAQMAGSPALVQDIAQHTPADHPVEGNLGVLPDIVGV